MTEPTTKAGQALLETVAPLGSYGDTAEEYEMEGDEIRWRKRYSDRILAIEAEAVNEWLASEAAGQRLATALIRYGISSPTLQLAILTALRGQEK